MSLRLTAEPLPDTDPRVEALTLRYEAALEVLPDTERPTERIALFDAVVDPDDPALSDAAGLDRPQDERTHPMADTRKSHSPQSIRRGYKEPKHVHPAPLKTNMHAGNKKPAGK